MNGHSLEEIRPDQLTDVRQVFFRCRTSDWRDDQSDLLNQKKTTIVKTPTDTRDHTRGEHDGDIFCADMSDSTSCWSRRRETEREHK